MYLKHIDDRLHIIEIERRYYRETQFNYLLHNESYINIHHILKQCGVGKRYSRIVKKQSNIYIFAYYVGFKNSQSY